MCFVAVFFANVSILKKAKAVEGRYYKYTSFGVLAFTTTNCSHDLDRKTYLFATLTISIFSYSVFTMLFAKHAFRNVNHGNTRPRFSHYVRYFNAFRELLLECITYTTKIRFWLSINKLGP